MNNEKFLDKFEEALKFAVSKEKIGNVSPLCDAMRYALSTGGKRVRPQSIKLGAEFAKGRNLSDFEIATVLELAVSLEMIHTYSLVHDDLPSMDNDDIRRGKPTVHKMFGDDMAILAGDALLNLALERLLEISVKTKDTNILSASSYMAKNAGVYGMVKGQCLDLNGSGSDLLSLLEVNKYKTGCLFKAGFVCGAIAMGANQKSVEDITIYAENVGATFQIVDDLLDSDTGETSVVHYIGKEEAKKLAEKFTKTAIDAVENYENSRNLIDFSNKLLNRVI